MPGFDFTAAAATDLITKVGHGLLTGDGPLTTIVPGGALGGLSSSADYWAIRMSADTLKVATSSANALAGTPIDITADIASGHLGIGIPYRRARTYVAKAVSVPGSQVKSADLNAKMDAFRGGWHGAQDFVFPASQFFKIDGAGIWNNGKWDGEGMFARGLPFAPGTKIHWIRFCYNRGGAGAVQFVLEQTRPESVFARRDFTPASIAAGTGEASTIYTAADIDATTVDSLLPANEGWTLTVFNDNPANDFHGVIVCASKAA